MTTLENIRAEILDKAYRNFDEHINDYTDEVVDLDDALEIIDRYAEKEPCEDTVSRKEIIEHYTTGEMANVHHIDKNHLLAFVEQLPSVRPQEPKSCEKCLHAEETDGSHCCECVKGESKFKAEPCDDVVSREWLKKKLQEHHDFFVNAYGGFKNMPQTEKARVDEIINCIAEVVNAPSVRPQPCDDAISREELLKAIDTWDKFGCDANTKLVPYQDHYIPYIHYDDVIKCIKGMPSVRPQEQTGHWIGHREHCENLGVMPSGLGAYEWCSNCDCGIDVKEWHRNNYNYCPNCGVRMERSANNG